MHIVVFPGWYPSTVDKLSGDFIQRHMEAIALKCKVSVVIPVKNSSIRKSDKVTIEKGNLTEIYHYYPSLNSFKRLDSLLSFLRYNYLCIKIARHLQKKEKIDAVYLYVLQKNHFTGLLLKWIYNIPYLISECSTFYIDGRFDKLSKIQKRLFRLIFRKSSSVHAVSKYFAEALKSKLHLQVEPIIIPNVVDANTFYFEPNQSKTLLAFVHVSNMSHQKNVEGMLRAFYEVKKENTNFHLHLVGPTTTSVDLLLRQLHLQNFVTVWHERDYKEVAEIMQQSDVFVFFTRHETFGCVIIEANACGLPVIVSDLEVTRELVSDKVNGVFVESENVADLRDKILFMINHHQHFDPVTISLQTRNMFNYERVGQQFFEWLCSIN